MAKNERVLNLKAVAVKDSRAPGSYTAAIFIGPNEVWRNDRFSHTAEDALDCATEHIFENLIYLFR